MRTGRVMDTTPQRLTAYLRLKQTRSGAEQVAADFIYRLGAMK